MEGLMPMSFDFTRAAAGDMGQQLRTGLNPFLTQMDDIMRRNNSTLHRIGHGVMTLVLGGLAALGAPPADAEQVVVVNLGFLELMAGGSFAFLVLIFLKLEEMDRKLARTNVRLGDISNKLDGIANAIAQLASQLGSALTTITGLLQSQVSLLGQILALLRAGLRVNGTLNLTGGVLVTVVVVGPSGPGSSLPISIEDLLKLLALGLLLAGFVALLGLALRTFTATGIVAMLMLIPFLAAMKEFATALAALSWQDVVALGFALGLLAGFVYLLGKALATFTAEAIEALPALGEFITKLGDFAEKLAKLSWKDVLALVASLAALGAFVYGLAVALGRFSAETLEALPNLTAFIDKLKELAVALAGFSAGDVVALVASLAALSAFVLALGMALSRFSAAALNAMPKLGEFIDKLKELALALAALSAGDVAVLVIGLAALAGFVFVLGMALARVSAAALLAAPKLGEFIDRLRELAVALANLSAGDVAVMVVGLAALAGFVYVLSLALAQLSVQALRALGPLGDFVEQLRQLATSLAQMSAADIAGMVIGLLGLAGFIYVLSLALNNFSAQAIQALPALSSFLDSLRGLAQTLAEMSATDLIGMGIGLALLAGFVYLLAAAINTLSLQSIMALPALAAVIEALSQLAGTLSAMGIGELLMLALGLALLVGFVFALGAAATFAAPGLTALASALNAINSTLENIVSAAGRAASALRSIAGGAGSLLGGVTSLLPSFDGGGVMPFTGPAMLHAGERVLTPEETRAFDRGVAMTGLDAPSGGGGGVDSSINVGGISINVNAGNVDQGSVGQLGDEIVRRIQERLAALRTEQDFRTGTRTAAT